jgi:hypothetical protein
MRKLIDNGSDALSLKNLGPYNPDGRKIILANAVFITGQWRRDSHKTPIKFEECEDTFGVLRLLNIKYPLTWQTARKNRINREVTEWVRSAAPDLPGLLAAQSEIEAQIKKLEDERERLSTRIAPEIEKRDSAQARADAWKTEMLNK